MPITFIRHCEAYHNVSRRHENFYDTSLTKRGISQAKRITGSYDIVICSPLARCIQTLKKSKIHYRDKIVEELFREKRNCKCDLLKNEKIEREDDDAIMIRVELIKDYIKQLPDDKDILVITHGDLIWFLGSYTNEGIRFGNWIGNGEMITYKDLMR